MALVIGGLLWWRFVRVPQTPLVVPETEAWELTRKEGNLVFAGIPKPMASQSIVILRNKAFVAGFDESRGVPRWVAYRVDRKLGATSPKRPGGFKIDKRTRSQVPSSEYARSGYDRGHMAPNFAIASRYGVDAQKETFLMSNICPQRPNLNRKVWNRIERLETDLADQLEELWVVTGPLFDDRPTYLGNRVEIPDAFFRMFVDNFHVRIRVLAVVTPQEVEGNGPPEGFLSSVDRIEQESGFDFFWGLSDENEERLESHVPKTVW